MKSLFIRTYLSVIAFTIVSFFLLLQFVVNPAIDNDAWQYFKEDALNEYQLVQDALSGKSKDSWEQLIADYYPTYFNTVELIPVSDILDDQYRSTLLKPTSQPIFSSFEDYPWFVLFNAPDTDKVIMISDYEDAEELGDTPLSERIQTFFPLLLVTLAQIVGVILIVRMIKAPVDKLVKITEHFAQGDFSVRAESNSPEPISKLAKGFNSMADEIQQAMVDKEVMIAAIPHELQTPLSRLRFLLELSRKKQTTTELRASIDKFEDNLDELEAAVSDILELTRITNFGSQDQETFLMLDLFKPIAEYYRDHESIRIKIDCDESLLVSAHAELLNRAVRNLVQNAFRYAESQCVVSAEIDQEKITVRVEDDGCGIPKGSRAKLLAPFSRLDQSRSQGTGGLGLGLALVKIVMDQHHGTVEVRDGALGGALIELTWPCPKD